MVITLIALIVFGAISSQYKAYKRKLDIIDVFILMSCLYFGIWPLIIAIIDPGSYSSNSWLVIISTLIVIISLVILWLLNFVLSNSKGFQTYKRFVNLDAFIEKVRIIDNIKISVLVYSLVLFIVYGYLEYGITKAFLISELNQQGVSLPVWYLFIYSSIRFLIFSAVAVVSVKIISNKNYKRFHLFFLFMLTMLLSIIFGRASILTSLLLFLFLYIKINQLHFFKINTIKNLLIVILLGYLALNIFQNARSAFLSPYAYTSGQTADSILAEGLLNLSSEKLILPDKQLDSLINRPSISKFNVMILDWQLNQSKSDNIPYGSLFVNSVTMIIPRFIWKNKPENNLQESYLFPMYGINYSKFQAPSLIGYAIADFGIFSVFIMPLMLIGLINLTLMAARIFYFNDASYIVLFLSILYSLFSIEVNYDSYIMNFRNAFFFASLFVLFGFIKKLLIVNNKTNQRL